MAATIDTGVEFFRQVLALRAYRQEILSADIANASTPGFKAVDLDFAGALNAATSRRPGSQTPANPRRGWLPPAAWARGGGGGAGGGAPPAPAPPRSRA